jgi:hypothetical protein
MINGCLALFNTRKSRMGGRKLGQMIKELSESISNLKTLSQSFSKKKQQKQIFI